MSKAFAKAFYNSKAWQSCRDSYIAKRVVIDGGMCEQCGEHPGEELHHKTFLNPCNIKNAAVSVNQDNLIWLCKDCHFKEHRDAIVKGFEKKRNQKILNNGCYFDDNGELQQMKVYIVYGAPCSGKTSYVLSHMDKTDLVVDLDYIRSAITYGERNTESNNLLGLSLDLREMIYKRIENRDASIDCKNVWIVSLLPKKAERAELAKRLNAQLIFIPATYEECVERAKEDESRKQRDLQINIIDKWFESWAP